MNSIEPKITISQKIEGNNLIMASSSTWSGNSNFLMKSQKNQIPQEEANIKNDNK